MVGASFYGRWRLPLFKSPPPLHGAPCRCNLRGLHESAVRLPVQAWQGVMMAARTMQRSSCPCRKCLKTTEQQACGPLYPRISTAPSAQGRAGVPSESADSLLGAPACADPYLSQVQNKDCVSFIQTLNL